MDDTLAVVLQRMDAYLRWLGCTCSPGIRMTTVDRKTLIDVYHDDGCQLATTRTFHRGER